MLENNKQFRKVRDRDTKYMPKTNIRIANSLMTCDNMKVGKVGQLRGNSRNTTNSITRICDFTAYYKKEQHLVLVTVAINSL